ncbi:hypothetical protein D3C80_1520170 [compost metagenome]
MTRKVFNANQQSPLLHSIHVCGSFSCHIVFIFTKRTEVNYWIFWIVIYVNIWCKVHMHPDTFIILCHFKPHFINQVFILHRTKCHLIWIRNCTVQTHSQTPFTV